MSVIAELRRQKGLYAVCPSCEEEFPMSKAILFDATARELPKPALDHLKAQRAELSDKRAELAQKKLAAATKPRIAAESVNIGKVVEKIAPSLPGFPVNSSDCRSLLEPIDYVVFRGLSEKGQIDSLIFVDVKSGKGRLSYTQSQVKGLVECGKVRLIIAERPEAK
jgi:predicted Holliday junction resolvase-like endonuclease